jgi:hypothetical protein
MIKKMSTAMLLVLVLFSLFSMSTKAYVETTENEISNMFHSWTLETVNDINIARSNRIKNTADNIRMSLNTTFAPGLLIATENAFLDSYENESSRISVYEDESTIHQINSYNLVYEAPEAPEWLFLKNDSDGWTVEIEQDRFYEIILVLNPMMSSSVKSYLMNALNNNYMYANQMAIDIDIEAESRYVIIDPTIEAELSLLPNTSGSIYQNTSSMANVSMAVDGYKISLLITYDRTYELEYTFSENTDMSVFNNEYKVNYYTYENQKFIVISHGEDSMFETSESDTFIPYTIWNLTTNEIETHYRFNGYVYSQAEENNNIYAYFYVDEFIIDHLLSISLAFRYKYIGIFSDSEYEIQNMILESDTEALGLDPTAWQLDFLVGTSTAIAIGSMIPGARWPIILIGTAAMMYVGSTIEDDPIQVKSIDEISEVINPSQEITSTLNQAYTLADSEFTGIDSDLKVFKLHLGQFNKPFTTGIHIDPSYSEINGQKGINIIQFTYRTSGQVYTIKGEHIDTKFTPGPGTIDPNDPDDTYEPDGPPFWTDPLFWIGISVLVILVSAILIQENKKYEMKYYARHH